MFDRHGPAVVPTRASWGCGRRQRRCAIVCVVSQDAGRGGNGVHGRLYLQGIGHIHIRGKARTTGAPVTCEIFHKAGRWYASVTLAIETIRWARGTAIGAFDWGLTEFLTIATSEGLETVANPRHLRNQLAELKCLGQGVARKIRRAQQMSGRQRGFPVSANLRRAISHLARLHAKVARRRQDFLYQTSTMLIKRFGALGTESLAVQNMVKRGGVRKKGLNREIHAAAPSAFLHMTRTKAEEAGSWYEELPTRMLKPTQRCHGPCGPSAVALDGGEVIRAGTVRGVERWRFHRDDRPFGRQ